MSDPDTDISIDDDTVKQRTLDPKDFEGLSVEPSAPDLEQEVEYLRSRWSEIQEQLTKSDELGKENKELKGTLSELTSKLAELEISNATLAGMEKAFEDKKQECESLKTQVITLERGISQTEGRFAEKELAQKSLTEELRGTRESRDELQKQLVQRDAEIEKLKERIALLEKGIGERSAAIRDLRGELENSQNNIAGLRNQIASLLEEKSHLKSEHQALKDVNVALEAELKSKQQMLEVFDKSAEKLTLLSESLKRLDSPHIRSTRPRPPEINMSGLPIPAGDGGTDRPAVRKIVALGQDEKLEYPLVKSRIAIGRSSDSDIRVYDPSVSRVHAWLIEEHGDIIVEDSESTNGIFVNAKPATRAVLHNGDVLTIGCYEFRFVDEAR